MWSCDYRLANENKCSFQEASLKEEHVFHFLFFLLARMKPQWLEFPPAISMEQGHILALAEWEAGRSLGRKEGIPGRGREWKDRFKGQREEDEKEIEKDSPERWEKTKRVIQ